MRRNGPPPPQERELSSGHANSYLRRRAGAAAEPCPGIGDVDLLAHLGLIDPTGYDRGYRRPPEVAPLIAYYRRRDLDALIERFTAAHESAA